GGEKISPLAIDAALRALPGVADAAAFGIPHPRLGEELVAAVVPAPGIVLDEAPLLAAARTVLGARRVPRRIWFVTELPRTGTGKVARHALAQHVGYDAARADNAIASAAPPADPAIVAALGLLWAAALGVERVEPDVDFFLLGGDSLRGAALLGEVRTALGVALPVEALFDDVSTI